MTKKYTNNKKYIVCPTSTPAIAAIERLLLADGWNSTSASNADEASLVIVSPKVDDAHIDPEMLNFYHRGLGGCNKAVLYLSHENKTQSVRDVFAPWLKILAPTIREVMDLLTWLNKSFLSHSEGIISRRLSPDACRELLEVSIGKPVSILGGPYTDSSLLSQDSIESWNSILSSHSMAEFYYHLCQLSKDHADYEHNAYKILDNPWVHLSTNSDAPNEQLPLGKDLVGSQVVRATYERSLLQTCEGLRRSLCNMVTLPMSNQGLSILLVDDAFDDFKVTMLAVMKHMMPDNCTLYIWNPASSPKESSPERIFRNICGYQSLKQKSLSQSMISVSQYKYSDNTVPQNTPILFEELEIKIGDLIENVQFVLVDQLFRFTSGTEMKGPEFIRGLSRLTRDMVSGDEMQISNRPELVAISRTPSPTDIREALMSGAKAYALKSSLLELPSILRQLQTHSSGIQFNGFSDSSVDDRVQIGKHATGSDIHKNLRALYLLPNETRSLLESAWVPRIPLHTYLSESEEFEHVASSERNRGFAQLIRSLPKTDLHVHVGSCMSPEFLVVGSLIGLLKYDYATIETLISASRGFFCNEVLRSGLNIKFPLKLREVLFYTPTKEYKESQIDVEINESSDWIEVLGNTVKDYLSNQCIAGQSHRSIDHVRYASFRSILHRELGIRDRLTPEQSRQEILRQSCLEVALFALKYSEAFQDVPRDVLTTDNLIRAYLLILAAMKGSNSLRTVEPLPAIDILELFRDGFADTPGAAWNQMHHLFYSQEETTSDTTTHGAEQLNTLEFRRNGWRLPYGLEMPFELSFHRGPSSPDWESTNLDFADGPITWSIATGLRSKNLVEYLEGCEFSGSTHLKHPFLMHVFAQQCLLDFIRQGVFYAELRGSPDGYVNPDTGFEFSDACQCFTEAFSQAQESILGEYQNNATEPPWVAGILGTHYDFRSIQELFNSPNGHKESEDNNIGDVFFSRLPCKVSLIYVGKRHKPTRQMILEAAAAAVSRSSGDKPIHNARDFVNNEFCRCRVVGFDLAGMEVDNPPALFLDEFARLSRLHIPLTVHAGENESAQFIEDSILGLGAQRIGHGLSLVEDPGLLARVREDRICVELCPISNHQTSFFGSPDEESVRRYPLRRLLDEGILVCINTDNPNISATNMVREFFQASYSYGGQGLSLWDVLRLIRFGFVCSFLSLSERRAMLELVSQYVIDLFSDPTVLHLLRDIRSLDQ